MNVQVFDEQGRTLVKEPGELVCTNSFPSMRCAFGMTSEATSIGSILREV